MLGNQCGSFCNEWNGGAYENTAVDEWSVWSRVLTDSEISNLYNNGAGLDLNDKTPQDPIDDLIEDIEDLVDDGLLNNGQGNSLISKLENIIDKLNNGQTSVACNKLDAFINQVNAFIKV